MAKAVITKTAVVFDRPVLALDCQLFESAASKAEAEFEADGFSPMLQDWAIKARTIALAANAAMLTGAKSIPLTF